MNSPFHPKTIQVPGILSDDALQEQLKQFAGSKNALQDAAPPPNSAVDFADKIQSEFLDKKGPAIRAPQAPPAAPERQKQDKAIDVRSNVLSGAGAAIQDPALRSLLLGPAIGLVGEGGPLDALGTLDSPEARQAEAERRAVDAAKEEAAAKTVPQMREELRGIVDEGQTSGGIRAVLMGEEDPLAAPIAEQNKQDQKDIADAQAKRKEAVAALTDPTKQPTQKWWLDAAQAGVRGAYDVPVSALKAPLIAWEAARDLTFLGNDEKSTARAWADTVDATLTKMLPGDKTRAKDFVHELSGGAGSMLGFMLAGFVGGAVGLPAEATTMMVGGMTGATQQFEDAESFNAVGLQKYMSFILGGAIGLTEAIPINRMLFRADAATGGLVRRMLTNTAAGGIEEFIQEVGQAIGNDAVAKMLYDEKRNFDVASYLKQGVIGALTGGLAGAATSMLHDTGITGQASPPDYVPVEPKDREALATQTIETLDQEFEALPGLPEATGQIEAERVMGPDAALAPVDTVANIQPTNDARPVARVVEGPGGAIPVREDGKLEITHWSSKALDVIDPARRGTGPLKGVERSRLGTPGVDPNVVDRSYFGVGDPAFSQRFAAENAKLPPRQRGVKAPTDPYHGEGLGPYQHTVAVDPNTIYNWYQDPLNLKAQLDRSTPATEQVTRYEKLIKDAGFKGVYFSESRLGQTAMMFEGAKPERVVDQRYNLPVGEIAAPADFAKPTARTFTEKGGWAVLTATQEAIGPATAPENVAANEKLRAELTKKKIPYQEVGGSYQGVDQGKSFMVFMPEAEAVKLGKRYKQESVLTRKGLEYADGRLVPSIPGETVVGDAARKNDFFSTLPNGEAFSVGLDFANEQSAEDLLANRQDVTQTEAFQKWFGDSKVVDADGKPLVVYHGTRAPGFEAFSLDVKNVLDEGYYGKGFYFTESAASAGEYARGGGKSNRAGIYPVYLRARNPFVWDVTRNGFEPPKFIGMKAVDVTSKLSKDGFDSVHVVRNGKTVEWVVFEPTQIKSVNNAGAFDPTDPNILANRGTGNRSPLKGEQTRPAQGIATNPNTPPAETVDVTLAKISQDVVKLLDATARQGRLTIKGKGVLGQYSRKQDVVRVKTMSDLSTVVHEGGHALYYDAGPALSKVITDNERVVMQAATDLYGGDVNTLSKSEHMAEGFAEFFRVYTLHRQFAETKYPQLTADFTAALQAEAPNLIPGLEIVGKKFEAWLQLPSAQLIRNKIVSGKQDAKFTAAIKELQDAGFPTWMHEVARNTVETSINRYAGFNDIVNQVLNKGQENAGQAIDLKKADDPRVLLRLAGNSGARAMIETTDGVMGYRSTQSSTRGLRDALLLSQGRKVTQNLGKIDPVRQQDFAAYLVALRGVDEYRRLAEGKLERPPFDDITLGDLHVSIKETEAKYGADFVEAARIVNEYGMGLWKKSFDAGLMSKETYTNGLDRQFYAPLQRDMSDKKKTLGPSALTQGASIVKRFRGSGRDIIDPMDVLMHKTFALEKIIAKNDAVKALATLADRAGKVGAMVERIPANQLIGKQFSVKEIARQLSKDDTISEADAEDLMTILQASIEDDNVLSLFRSEQASTKGENIVFFWDSGRLAAIQLVDGQLGADVVNTLNGIGRENLPMFVDLIAATSTAFRSAITSWPDFLAVNFIRDQLSAFILTDVGFKPFYTGIKGTFDELRQRQWAKQYNAAMGIMGGMNVASLHNARVNRDIGALRKKGYLAKAFGEGGMLGAVKGLANIAELTETGTRVGIYKNAFERARKDGLSDYEASIEAGYTATDYMDFGLNGSKMLLWRRTIPFLNAQLQGLYKMMRTLGADEVRQRKGTMFVLRSYLKSTQNLDLSRTEKMAVNTGRKAWVKMMSLGLISAALHFLFEDDPDYQEAGEYLRTTGWVIPLGDGRIFYVPKPFELAVFANFVERGLEAANGDESAKGRFMRGLAMNLFPPTSPPAIQIGVELAANYDFFSDREIVPSYMQALAPELQFNNYTSELAKSIGQATGVSPMVLDHIMSGLGASAYRDMTTATNALDPNRPDMDATDAPILRRFIRDARRGSTSSKDFWGIASTLNGSLRRAETTYKAYLEAGNENAANAFLATLDEDDRAYALLTTHFKADAKKLNPFYRGRQLTTVVSAMRREMVSELGLEDTTTKAGGSIMLTSREKADLDEALSEYARREMRNTLIAMGAPGWVGKKPLPADSTIDLIRAIEPRAAEELQRRVKKAGVYSFDTVNTYWPEVKDRLLRDRENTFLKDILTIAKVMR